MKRKSTTEENPTTAMANGDKTESKKRRRLSNEEAAPSKDTKRSKKDKQERKEKKKEKKHKKKSREEQAAALDAVYDEEAAPFGREEQDQAMDDRDSKPAKKTSKFKPDTAAAAAAEAEGSAKPEKSKKKKSKKDKKSTDDSKSENPEEGAAPAAAVDGEEKTVEQKQQDQENARPKKAARFIVFVGNLPYSATVGDIEQHFSAVHPTAVRLLHEKTNPNKSRGVAFVEFAGYDHMKTCLKTLHHSTMTCQGRDYHGRPKDDERKINVELTAGGGGNTDYRKERIRAKNEKLTGEREHRAKQEEIEKIKKEKERLLKGGAQKTDANGIHPSRLARVPIQK
ncbi:hypothetical protein PG994_007599 [Apiospora phragmitis]|uniref:RRM domain-containing protein n=1 Tax=Apiospora phragmitis TaxID=2905665 RepID=A0ABR1V1A3_9PEZI